MGKDEKSELISKSVPFTISALERGKTRFKDDAFTLTVQIAGEDRKMEFGYGTMKDPTEATSRDRSLQRLLGERTPARSARSSWPRPTRASTPSWSSSRLARTWTRMVSSFDSR